MSVGRSCTSSLLKVSPSLRAILQLKQLPVPEESRTIMVAYWNLARKMAALSQINLINVCVYYKARDLINNATFQSNRRWARCPIESPYRTVKIVSVEHTTISEESSSTTSVSKNGHIFPNVVNSRTMPAPAADSRVALLANAVQ